MKEENTSFAVRARRMETATAALRNAIVDIEQVTAIIAAEAAAMAKVQSRFEQRHPTSASIISSP